MHYFETKKIKVTTLSIISPQLLYRYSQLRLIINKYYYGSIRTSITRTTDMQTKWALFPNMLVFWDELSSLVYINWWFYWEPKRLGVVAGQRLAVTNDYIWDQLEVVTYEVVSGQRIRSEQRGRDQWPCKEPAVTNKDVDP